MKHVHAGTCEKCKRDYYAIVFRNDEPRSLGTVIMYHLDERCALLPSYDELQKTA